jgi:hypothetical protein
MIANDPANFACVCDRAPYLKKKVRVGECPVCQAKTALEKGLTEEEKNFWTELIDAVMGCEG